ncbi:hypothetical protein [Streptomyces sp. TE5632]
MAAPEVEGAAEDEQVENVQLRMGLAGDTDGGAAGRVQTLTALPDPVTAVRFGSGLRRVEVAVLDHRALAVCLADYAVLVTVLHMGAHARQADPYGYAVPL